jgi:TolB-like protein
MPSLLQRLKERKLFQWALAYLAGAWLVFQGIEVLAEPWNLSEGVQRTIHVLLGVGFFITLILAWYHGEKGRQRVSGVELLILTGILIIAGLLVTVLRPRAGGTPEAPEPSAVTVSESGRPSVAALPFTNLSELQGDVYFTDGMHEQILTQLSKVGSLSVRGRTSAMEYRDSPKNLREIGRELNARYVLEGSVFREGETVRINVQLIDAQQDEHLWAEDYERDLSVESLIAVQSDIAERVAQALEAELTPDERARIEARPTGNLQAYDLYLLGRHYYNQHTREGYEQAIAYFERAIEQDSAFALAYSGLAFALMDGSTFGIRRPRDVYPRAKVMALKALEIDNTFAEAYGALASIEDLYEWNWPKAEALYQRALELSPQYANGHFYYGYFLMALGRFEQAKKEFVRAHALDPMSPRLYFALGQPLYYGGELEQALEHCRAAQAMYPEYEEGGCTGGYLAVGRYEEAIAEAESGRGQHGVILAPGSEPQAYLAMAYALAGRKDEARRVLHELHTRSRAEYVSPSALARVYVGLGEADSAMFWLERAYEDRTYAVVWIRNDPLMETLRSDPRFQDLVRRLNFPE